MIQTQEKGSHWEFIGVNQPIHVRTLLAWCPLSGMLPESQAQFAADVSGWWYCSKMFRPSKTGHTLIQKNLVITWERLIHLCSENEHKYPSEENHSSLQTGYWLSGFGALCFFILSCAHTSTRKTKQNLNRFSLEFIPEDAHASTDHARNQSSMPALDFSTLQDTVKQCWIIFHIYMPLDCSYSLFQKNPLHYLTICFLYVFVYMTFSQFGPKVILICTNSDQNYTNLLTSPQWAVGGATLDFTWFTS